MKINHGLVLAAALVVGSLAVTGCRESADENATDENATTEQVSVVGEQGTVQAVGMNEGFTQDCGNAPARRVVRTGFRRGERARFRPSVGFRFGNRGVQRAWWRVW